ncbi:class I SAM-dependent methyltransferase [Algoriphagus sp. AGSA1]|uniref:O-methyltransferase n=1 Tax=Algoriphagus sp. AGSA1 TaxID=2907213 RepID=UPI001F165E44|nr:class I SAM-dependent methyltransferase [Algoriphagus sp. AGSA1]MCE7056487.1 class I SAM-dependent methyltransferase [Algoriphagus sp. AGSA1]
MHNNAYSLLSYIKYWLIKEDKYSLQSPFLFTLYQNLFRFLHARKDEDQDIEMFRNQLLSCTKSIEVKDHGAGSKTVNTPKRAVADITKYSTSNRKYAQLYQYFATLTPAHTVLELGTCMGICSRYLSKVTHGQVYTFEGSPEIARVAKPGQGYDNVHVVVGELSDKLPPLLSTLGKIDFALIDATHTYEATLRYFEQLLPQTHPKTIIAIGDIHWSREMEQAWEAIKNKPQVQLSLDFYECGIVFFEYPGAKAEYVLDF